MDFHVLTLFPDMVRQGLNTSIIGRAMKEGHITLNTVNIRDFSINKHNRVDDYPYGGGAGMVIQAEPVYRAWESVAKNSKAIKQGKKPRCIYLTPQGKVFHQTMVEEFAQEEELIFLCGHYEGIDERVLEEVVTDYVSIGDYVLTGGELASMVIAKPTARPHGPPSTKPQSRMGKCIGQSILPTCGRWPVTMGSTKASARKSAASTTLRAGEEFLVFICFLL